MKLRVKCTLFVDVEVPDDPNYDAQFDIEERHCSGTGPVGAAIEEAIDRGRALGVCWGCNLEGKSEIARGVPLVDAFPNSERNDLLSALVKVTLERDALVIERDGLIRCRTELASVRADIDQALEHLHNADNCGRRLV